MPGCSDSENLEDALECNSLKTNSGKEWESNPPTAPLRELKQGASRETLPPEIESASS